MLIGSALVSTQDAPAPQGGAPPPQGGAPPPQGGAPTFRTGVNIVRVDVIVADEKGKPVTDLAKDEFEIVEDGRPQTIELFRHIRIDEHIGGATFPSGVEPRHRRA